MGVHGMMISDGLAARIAEEGITPEAVAQALDLGRAAGDLLIDDDGTFVTHAQIGSITLWVRYREQPGGAVEVVDAYHHRIELV